MLLAFGLLVGFTVSLLPGVVNGVLIARLGVPPFIGTLGMYGVARGIGFLTADATTVPVDNSWLFELGNGRLAGIPVPVIVVVVVTLMMHYLLSQTRFGQYTYAIGGNRQAAIRAGIKVRRHVAMIYVLAAGCAGIAGILFAARFSAGAPQGGEAMLLDSIAAVVIGGASLFGGSGTIVGTVIGALIIAVIQYGLVFINVEPFWQFVAVGAVIIVSVLIDQSRSRLEARDPSVTDESILSARSLVQALRRRARHSARCHLNSQRERFWRLPVTTVPGKSTLIKLISGVHLPDAGEIRFKGERTEMNHPRVARGLGIETIYQDLSLADNLDIGANVFLGREPERRVVGLLPILDRRHMREQAQAVLETLGIEIGASEFSRPVRNLSGGQRQAIAIGRAIFWKAELLILDEPTASLGVPEQRKVRELITRLKRQNVAVLFISHNLAEIFEISDRVLVLHQGKKAGERRIPETDNDEIVKLMVGA